jgi:hypothetical protein
VCPTPRALPATGHPSPSPHHEAHHRCPHPPFFLVHAREPALLSPFSLHPIQMPLSAPLTSRPHCALLSDSKRATTSPYSPLPHRHSRAPKATYRRWIPASGGSRLHVRPLPSLEFVSWLTSSSFSRCCRSCPRSSTVVVGAHHRQEAAAPPSSTTSPPPSAVAEHPSYPHCSAAYTYYHGAQREEVVPIRSSASRCAPRRRGRTGRSDRVPPRVSHALCQPCVGRASSARSVDRSRPSTVCSVFFLFFNFVYFSRN